MPVTSLPNGARIVTEKVDSVYSAAIDLWVEVGSAYEEALNNGVTHFIEHMLFKGTGKRDAESLMEEIEDVGGMVSASTSRDTVKLYGYALGDALPVVSDIMLDMALAPRFDAVDFELERKVILDEIDMYADDPVDVAQDLLYAGMWKGSPQARPITGGAEEVKALTLQSLRDHFQTYFRPERMIVSVAGSFDEERLIDSVSQSLSQAFPVANESAAALSRPQAPAYFAVEELVDWDTEQAQVALAFPAISSLDERQEALQILDLCLATSNSSRLFKEVREKRGLAYSIGSIQHSYRDFGLYSFGASVSCGNAEAVMSLIFEELENIKKNGLTDREIARAKAQLRTEILTEKESMAARSTANASDLMYFGRLSDIGENLARVEKVDNAQIIDLARLIFVDDYSLVAVGPQNKLKSLFRGAKDSQAGKGHRGRVKFEGKKKESTHQ